MIWFPELFYRFEEFETLHPNERASVCEVSSVVLPGNITNTHDEFCGEPISNSVFLHTLIIGLACIPTSFWLPLCVHRLGAKFFLGKIKIDFLSQKITVLRSLQFIGGRSRDFWFVFRQLDHLKLGPLLYFRSFDQFGYQHRLLCDGRTISY